MKNQFDIIYLVIMGFVVSLIGVVILVAWTQLSTSPAYATLISGSSPQAQAVTTSATTTLNLLGNMLAFVWIISGIASIIATFFIDTSPVFAIVGIILLPIEAFLGLIFHDFFFIVAQNTFISPIVNALPQLAYFFTLYPIICVILAIASIIFTFVKPSG